MGNGLYAIDMPVTELLEFYQEVGGSIVSEFPILVADWHDLRREVREGQEILLTGSVPEGTAVFWLHAVVIEFDDDARQVKVVA